MKTRVRSSTGYMMPRFPNFQFLPKPQLSLVKFGLRIAIPFFDCVASSPESTVYRCTFRRKSLFLGPYFAILELILALVCFGVQLDAFVLVWKALIFTFSTDDFNE